ncbi:lipopolysaccharide biosynthesis protein [Flavobacterium anhuiense]|uniref:lipopolysaccharide biosynthesis protein n=1 Tax=Flavobacterium anhuiense TaxID=459526 RepID=UPI003D990693
MSNSLSSTAVKGIIWSAIDKFAVQLGQFTISIILARILMPEDFGLLGMLAIFIALSQTFIESGMGLGLIQRQDRTNIDFSTVFVFNLAVSTLFYLLLFFSAPLIASYFDQPLLIDLTRILGLNLFINSLSIVQRTKLTIAMDFKAIAKTNVIGVILGGIAGVIAAMKGFGVWSLVLQTLLGSFSSALSLWFFSHWKPSIAFSRTSFKNLFGFGSKLLLSGLYAQLINNVYNIFIGKYFSISSLGYYTRAKGFADISAGTITSILQQATFPILASVQNDKEKLVSVYRRMIRMSSFCIMPIMTLIALLAKPIVILLLTEKWIFVIPLLQWMVFARIFFPMSAINMNLLNAIGRSDLFLKMDLSKLPITAIAMIVTIPLGVTAMVIGQVVTSGISFFLNAYLPGKFYGYGPLSQLKDMFPVLLATMGMSLLVFLLTLFLDSLILQLIIGSILAAFSYLFFSWLLKLEELFEVKKMCLGLLKK